MRWVNPAAALLSLAITWHVGKAGVYSNRFDGHTMANGKTYHHKSYVVANRHIPLGTDVVMCIKRRCKRVKVQDRGPYIKGRTFDISPALARSLGVKPDGVIQVRYRVIKH